MIKRIRDFDRDGFNKYPSYNYNDIIDVVRLIKNNEYPDNKFSDDECNLYSALKSILERGEASDYIPYSCKGVSINNHT